MMTMNNDHSSNQQYDGTDDQSPHHPPPPRGEQGEPSVAPAPPVMMQNPYHLAQQMHLMGMMMQGGGYNPNGPPMPAPPMAAAAMSAHPVRAHAPGPLPGGVALPPLQFFAEARPCLCPAAPALLSAPSGREVALVHQLRGANAQVGDAHAALQYALIQMNATAGRRSELEALYFNQCHDRLVGDGQRAARAIWDTVLEVQAVMRSLAFEARSLGVSRALAGEGGALDVEEEEEGGRRRRCAVLEAQLCAARAEAEAAQAQSGALARRVKALEEERAAPAAEGEAPHSCALSERLQRENAELRDNVDELEADFKELEEQQSTMLGQYKTLFEEHAELKAKLEEVMGDCEAGDRRVKGLSERLQSMSDRYSSAVRKNEKLTTVAIQAVSQARNWGGAQIGDIRTHMCELAETVDAALPSLNALWDSFEAQVKHINREAEAAVAKEGVRMGAELERARARCAELQRELERQEHGAAQRELEAAMVKELRVSMQLQRVARGLKGSVLSELAAIGQELAAVVDNTGCWAALAEMVGRAAFAGVGGVCGDVGGDIGAAAAAEPPPPPPPPAVVAAASSEDRLLSREEFHGLPKDVRKQLLKGSKAARRVDELEGELLVRGRELANLRSELKAMSKLGARQATELERFCNALREKEAERERLNIRIEALDGVNDRFRLLCSAVRHRFPRETCLSPMEEFLTCGISEEDVPISAGPVIKFLLAEMSRGWVEVGITQERLLEMFGCKGVVAKERAAAASCVSSKVATTSDSEVVTPGSVKLAEMVADEPVVERFDSTKPARSLLRTVERAMSDVLNTDYDEMRRHAAEAMMINGMLVSVARVDLHEIANGGKTAAVEEEEVRVRMAEGASSGSDTSSCSAGAGGAAALAVGVGEESNTNNSGSSASGKKGRGGGKKRGGGK